MKSCKISAQNLHSFSHYGSKNKYYYVQSDDDQVIFPIFNWQPFHNKKSFCTENLFTGSAQYLDSENVMSQALESIIFSEKDVKVGSKFHCCFREAIFK